MILHPHDIRDIIQQINESEKLVSVCIPSRGRVRILKEAVESLQNTATDLSRIEFVFRVDEDDTETIEYVQSVENAKVIVGKNLGYAAHRERMGDMFAEAEGQYLLLTGDDHQFVTNGWDDCIANHKGQVAIVFFGEDITFATHAAIPLTLGMEGIEPYSTDILYLYLALRLGIYARYDIKVQDRFRQHSPPSPLTPIPIVGTDEPWASAKKQVLEYVSVVDELFQPKTVGFYPSGTHGGTVNECFGMQIHSRPIEYEGGMPRSVG